MEQGKKKMSKGKGITLNLLAVLVVGFAYFYVSLPALNLQSPDFYVFIGLLCVVYIVAALVTSGITLTGGGAREYLGFIKSQCLPIGLLLVALILIALLGSVLSMPLFRASAYRDLLQVETGDFATEVDEISFDQIPMLDNESAQRLGNRVLGDLDDMVSQFEVSDVYSQINYQNRPVRVAYLNYGDLIKWFTNRTEGLPGYIIIDMVTQEAEVVRLSEGMKYAPSEPLNRNLYRHLRFQYPTFMFATPVFEIDENGDPWWICPKLEKTIGLFGGDDINGAVLMNAVTGESTYYEYEDVPTWVDRVYSADLIIQQYDYHGMFVNGFLNSILGQKDVTVTTDGYNYIAMDDDVFMYTGVTSVTSDQSNVGFLLTNQRTKATKYYRCSGATEYSAMDSAQGVVQHLGYTATFPLLLNISGEPTYFMALKDNAQLVKMYAMVNVRQYTIVATGTSVAECEQQYIRLLADNNITAEVDLPETSTDGVIEEIRTAVLEGNSYYFLRLKGEEVFYSVSAAANPLVVVLNVGDHVTIEHAPAVDGMDSPILDGYGITKWAVQGPVSMPAYMETDAPSPAPETLPSGGTTVPILGA